MEFLLEKKLSQAALIFIQNMIDFNIKSRSLWNFKLEFLSQNS